MIKVKATIYFENKFWVGLFEKTDDEGYVAAKHLFGQEPTDPEIYAFIKKNYSSLKFGSVKELQIEIKRVNPKRLQRQVRKEMDKIKATSRPSTYAQDYLREELEINKKIKKHISSTQKQEEKEKKFLLKQDKKKKKMKGH